MPAPSPELSLELDRPNRTYQAGETIQGWLRVAGPRRERIELSLSWRTSGKGNVDRGKPHEVLTLHEPEGVPEDQARGYPLSFTAPKGPPSYRGQVLRLDWTLRAEAGGGLFSPKLATEEDLVLEAAQETVLAGQRRRRRRARRPTAVQGGSWGVALALLGATAALGAGAWKLGGNALCPCLFASLFTGVAGLAALRNPLAERRLGPVHLEVSDEVSPGEPVRVRLVISPPWRLDLNGIRVHLEGRESATSGSGSGAETHTHQVLYERRVLLERARGLRGQQVLETEIRVPADAPVSFASGSNRVHYELELRVDIPSWPDWHVELPVLVLPSGQRAAPRVRVVDLQARQRCPWCRDLLAQADEALSACDACGTVLHEGCWAEAERCPTAGCGQGWHTRARVQERQGEGGGA